MHWQSRFLFCRQCRKLSISRLTNTTAERTAAENRALSFLRKTNQAQRRSKRNCKRRLPRGRTALQRLLRRVQRLHKKERRHPFRNLPAAERSAGISRPRNSMERSRARGKTQESAARLQLRYRPAKRIIHRGEYRAGKRICAEMSCQQRHDCRSCRASAR